MEISMSDIIEELDTVLIINECKKGTVVDISADGIFTVEYCDDSLLEGEDDKWQLFRCKTEDLKLIHKGPMLKDEK